MTWSEVMSRITIHLTVKAPNFPSPNPR